MTMIDNAMMSWQFGAMSYVTVSSPALAGEICFYIKVTLALQSQKNHIH